MFGRSIYSLKYKKIEHFKQLEDKTTTVRHPLAVFSFFRRARFLYNRYITPTKKKKHRARISRAKLNRVKRTRNEIQFLLT